MTSEKKPLVDKFKVAVRALIHKSETDIFARAWACQTGRTTLVRNYFHFVITGFFCVLVLASSLSCDESSNSEAWDISGEWKADMNFYSDPDCLFLSNGSGLLTLYQQHDLFPDVDAITGVLDVSAGEQFEVSGHVNADSVYLNATFVEHLEHCPARRSFTVQGTIALDATVRDGELIRFKSIKGNMTTNDCCGNVAYGGLFYAAQLSD